MVFESSLNIVVVTQLFHACILEFKVPPNRREVGHPVFAHRKGTTIFERKSTVLLGYQGIFTWARFSREVSAARQSRRNSTLTALWPSRRLVEVPVDLVAEAVDDEVRLQ